MAEGGGKLTPISSSTKQTKGEIIEKYNQLLQLLDERDQQYTTEVARLECEHGVERSQLNGELSDAREEANDLKGTVDGQKFQIDEARQQESQVATLRADLADARLSRQEVLKRGKERESALVANAAKVTAAFEERLESVTQERDQLSAALEEALARFPCTSEKSAAPPSSADEDEWGAEPCIPWPASLSSPHVLRAGASAAAVRRAPSKGAGGSLKGRDGGRTERQLPRTGSVPVNKVRDNSYLFAASSPKLTCRLWWRRFRNYLTGCFVPPSDMLNHVREHLREHSLLVFEQIFDQAGGATSIDEFMELLCARLDPTETEADRVSRFHNHVQGVESVDKFFTRLSDLASQAFPVVAADAFDSIMRAQFIHSVRAEIAQQLKLEPSRYKLSDVVERARQIEAALPRDGVGASKTAGAAAGGGRGGGAPRGTFSRGRGAAAGGAQQRPPASANADTSEQMKVPSNFTPLICDYCGMRRHSADNCYRNPDSPYYKGDSGEGAAVTSKPNRGGANRGSGVPRGAGNRKVATVQDAADELGLVSGDDGDEVNHLYSVQSPRPTRADGAADADVNLVDAPSATKPTVPLVSDIAYCESFVEGRKCQAMLDSCSAASIVSLPFLQLLVRADRSIRSKIDVPKRTLAGYGGALLSHIRYYVPLKVNAPGGPTVEVPCFIDPYSKNDLLLGYGAQGPLGYVTYAPGGQPLISKPGGLNALIASDATAAALTRDTHFRPGHSTKVGVWLSPSVVAQFKGKLLIFEPGEALQNACLEGDAMILRPNRDGYASIVVRNSGATAVDLEKGAVVGTIEPSTRMDWKIPAKVSQVGAAKFRPSKKRRFPNDGVLSDEERRTKLAGVLNPEKLNALSGAELQRLVNWLVSQHDVFSLHDLDLGECLVEKHEIDTGNAKPARLPNRRTAFALREEIKKELIRLKEAGVIVESNSPWNAQFVPVRKPDGSIRICVDYRDLNAVTVSDAYPLPRCDDLIDSLGNIKARVLSKLDLKSGYYQVLMDAASAAKTAFSFPGLGSFEYKRLPMGVKNAPATFSRVMAKVLKDADAEHVFCYLDDILVATDTVEKHEKVLDQLFRVLRNAGLKLNADKCDFFRTSVKYLGFVLSSDGLKSDPAKIAKVSDFPQPHNVRVLRTFLGLCAYNRRFVKGMSALIKPLTRLTQKGVKFEWSDECEMAFKEVKIRLTSPPVLSYPNFNEPFILETDASYDGLGSVLAQKGDDGLQHTIAYASRPLKSAEKNYGVTELEAAAMVFGLRHFRPYLLMHQVRLVTDHSALTTLLTNRKIEGKIARWLNTIVEIDPIIEYRSGPKNQAADCLSRMYSDNSPDLETGPTTAMRATELLQPFLHAAVNLIKGDALATDLAATQRADSFCQPLIHYLETGELPSGDTAARAIVLEAERCAITDGVLERVAQQGGEPCICVPETLRQTLLLESHSCAIGGHFNPRKMYERLRRRYYWPQMRADVFHHVRACVPCAARQGQSRRSVAPLMPIEIVPVPFYKVGMDIVKLTPTKRGHTKALVIVDYFSKWAEVYPLRDERAATIARKLMKFIARFGAPREIISDQGVQFMSDMMGELCAFFDIKQLVRGQRMAGRILRLCLFPHPA